MPFKSEKQRRYLWANEPELARKWAKKYSDTPTADQLKKAAKKRLLKYNARTRQS